MANTEESAWTIHASDETQPQSESECPICGEPRSAVVLTAPDRFHLRKERYHLRRCSSCSCTWLPSPPLPEEMSYHYSSDYHAAITAAGEGSAENRWRRQRELIAQYKQNGSILDIGCSSGGFLGTMKGAFWKLYGIELEASTAEKARLATGAEVFIGDVLDAPFPAQSFDVITCFDLLEHVYNPIEFLSRVRHWLKPGGIVYVMLPNIDSWEAKIFGSYWYGLELPRHLFHFSPRSLRRTMNSLAFEEICLSTPGTTYVERSCNYLYSGIIAKCGITPVAQSKAQKHTVVWKAIRKLIRISLVKIFSHVACLCNRGASMEAVFKKPVGAER